MTLPVAHAADLILFGVPAAAFLLWLGVAGVRDRLRARRGQAGERPGSAGDGSPPSAGAPGG